MRCPGIRSQSLIKFWAFLLGMVTPPHFQGQTRSFSSNLRVDLARCIVLSALEYCVRVHRQRPRQEIPSCYAHANNFLSTLTDKSNVYALWLRSVPFGIGIS
ncbi:hypothetical protein EDB86DRAFT_2964346 [Lactarius hatsudake]|nr:hypothetical protein EDB86DRAFT_2974310 [Lactarius hatsudake]KAH8984214.1 hypothetical protein EDB86DRAFT_2964346 [Lactarius hatsudake]